MGEKVKLDPRIITGEISLDTPYFILEYISLFCKITYNKNYISFYEYHEEIVNLMNTFEYVEVDLPSEYSSDEDLRKLIKFISPNSSSTGWNLKSIIEGCYHLLSFNVNIDKLAYINSKDIIYGSKTNEKPFTINEIIAYRIANFYKYPTDRTTTYDEIKYFIDRKFSKGVPTLKNSLLHTINGLSDSDLLKIYHIVNNISEVETRNDIFNFEEEKDKKWIFDPTILEISLNDFFDRKKLASRIKPRTNYEAIISAVLRYGINISESSYPLKELENLSKKRYIPYCPSFSRKYSINKEYYNINKRWTESLSNSNIYTIEQLKRFAYEEGFTNLTGMSFIELNRYLKSSRNINNFYFGRNPNCNETKTILLLEDINDIPQEELICIGIERINNLKYISLEELTDYFENMKMYIDPINNEMLDQIVISKLKIYCNEISSKSSNANRLLKVMEDIDKIGRLLDIKVISLKTKILKLPIDEQKKIELFFNKVMELGLYMRGWKVNDNIDFPLLSEETLTNDRDIIEDHKIKHREIYMNGDIKCNSFQFIIDNTQEALEKALNVLNTLPFEIIENIKSLHTLYFNKKGTIQEIMGYIFKGTRVFNDELLVSCMKNIFRGLGNPISCLRTNSNYILFSSIWYMMIFGYKVPFRIDRIDDIQ